MFFLNRYQRSKFISSRNNFQMQITISFFIIDFVSLEKYLSNSLLFFLSLVCKSEEFSTKKLLSKYDSLSIVKIRNLVNRKTLSNVTIYQTQTGFLFLFVIFANELLDVTAYGLRSDFLSPEKMPKATVELALTKNRKLLLASVLATGIF